ncbi:MAG TPA: MFS transporter [Actinocrinis sp.]|nr:MFS transporter [Actinocrinis sp.]
MTRSSPNRWLAVAALVPALLAVGFDATILNLALPELAGGLHASSLQLQWFIAACTLVFAAAMVPGGMLGDRYGRK